MRKTKLHKYGKLYFTNEMTLGEMCKKEGIHPTRASELMHSLFDDPTFDMGECNRIREKKIGGKLARDWRNTFEPPAPSLQERKIAFSDKEEDYGFGHWMESDERRAYVNGGLKFTEWLKFLGNKIMNLKKEE